jgi:hypothetical protein
MILLLCISLDFYVVSSSLLHASQYIQIFCILSQIVDSDNYLVAYSMLKCTASFENANIDMLRYKPVMFNLRNKSMSNFVRHQNGARSKILACQDLIEHIILLLNNIRRKRLDNPKLWKECTRSLTKQTHRVYCRSNILVNSWRTGLTPSEERSRGQGYHPSIQSVIARLEIQGTISLTRRLASVQHWGSVSQLSSYPWPRKYVSDHLSELFFIFKHT